MAEPAGHSHDPLAPHSHEPNPDPPSPDSTFLLRLPQGRDESIGVEMLLPLPRVEVPDCYIVSTGHGISGPFRFGGVTLRDLIAAYSHGEEWEQAEIVSSDGFGTRVRREEIESPSAHGPILLAYLVDGEMMTRAQGLVRLVVPSERDDALRQVKWVGEIRLR